MCLFLCVWLCVCVSVYMCESICACVYVYVYMYISVYIWIYIYIYIYIYIDCFIGVFELLRLDIVFTLFVNAQSLYISILSFNVCVLTAALKLSEQFFILKLSKNRKAMQSSS